MYQILVVERFQPLGQLQQGAPQLPSGVTFFQALEGKPIGRLTVLQYLGKGYVLPSFID